MIRKFFRGIFGAAAAAATVSTTEEVVSALTRPMRRLGATMRSRTKAERARRARRHLRRRRERGLVPSPKRISKLARRVLRHRGLLGGGVVDPNRKTRPNSRRKRRARYLAQLALVEMLTEVGEPNETMRAAAEDYKAAIASGEVVSTR